MEWWGRRLCGLGAAGPTPGLQFLKSLEKHPPLLGGTFSILVILCDVIPIIALDALGADEIANRTCVSVKSLLLPSIDQPGYAVSVHHGEGKGGVIVQVHLALFDGPD